MEKKERLIRFDWAMKSLLRRKANFDILEGFLSALLGYDIVVEEILESESDRESEKLKFNRVDILVKDANENRFIMEVQAETESDYLERLLYGTSKTIVETLEIGQPYKNIKKVISISIMFFNLGSAKDYLYHGKTEFRGIHTGELLEVKHLVAINDENNKTVHKFQTKQNIYPEYYLIEVERFKDKILGAIDEWIYFFKNEEIKESFCSRNIQKARDKLNLLKMSEEERRAYEKYLMDLASEKDVIETARAEGEQKGYVKGEKKGFVKGEKKGFVKGKIEDILEVLGAKGVVSASLEERIREQQDPERLKSWFSLACRAASIEEFTDRIEKD